MPNGDTFCRELVSGSDYDEAIAPAHFAKRLVRCPHCGAPGLTWEEGASGAWHLYEGRKLHECKNTTEKGNTDA